MTDNASSTPDRGGAAAAPPAAGLRVEVRFRPASLQPYTQVRVLERAYWLDFRDAVHDVCRWFYRACPAGDIESIRVLPRPADDAGGASRQP